MNKYIQALRIFSKKLFSINNFDNHCVLYLLGIRIRKKLSPAIIDTSIVEYGLNKEYRETKVILSLTSFPERISIVPFTIRTLLKQSFKPDEIILWLGEEQFPNKKADLPNELLELEKYGLTIKWCKDIRSYKKLLPALKEYPNDILITFDDDIYYPTNTVETLYKSYLADPNCIHTHRGRRFYLKNNEIYSKSAAEMYWTRYNDCSFLNQIVGCGGVLYPPHCLCDKVFDEKTFMKIVPTQDDIWFWAMAILNNTKIKQVASYDIQLPTIEGSQQYGLCKINNKNSGKGMNSLDAANIIVKEYPEIVKNIIDENKL